jgi:mono/diheme cytochrome c family protein
MSEAVAMRLLILLLGSIIGFALGAGTGAGEEAKPGANALLTSGHEFALQVCSACHMVARDQRSKPILKPPALSFSTIANRPKTTEPFLRQFLSTPHGKMPNPELADFQIDEVVAYLLSLKSKR